MNSTPAPPVAGVSERFRAATREVRSAAAGPVELLPSRLATAAADVLSGDGAGLSLLTTEVRVPLGASNPSAAQAERLQFTTRQGPCWDAVNADRPLACDAAQIEQRWPEFHDDLVRTPFRSVVSVPLRLSRGTGGALDLYFIDGSAAGRFDLGDATVVAAHVADTLVVAADEDTSGAGDLQGPPWLHGPAAVGRLGVWIAAGMLMAGDGCRPDDAVALLRATAHSAGRTLDEVAADVVEGRIPVRDVLDGAR